MHLFISVLTICVLLLNSCKKEEADENHNGIPDSEEPNKVLLKKIIYTIEYEPNFYIDNLGDTITIEDGGDDWDLSFRFSGGGDNTLDWFYFENTIDTVFEIDLNYTLTYPSSGSWEEQLASQNLFEHIYCYVIEEDDGQIQWPDSSNDIRVLGKSIKFYDEYSPAVHVLKFDDFHYQSEINDNYEGRANIESSIEVEWIFD